MPRKPRVENNIDNNQGGGYGNVLMAGYVLLAALPDLRRYIRISTM